jgi:hypothetical protein
MPNANEAAKISFAFIGRKFDYKLLIPPSDLIFLPKVLSKTIL